MRSTFFLSYLDPSLVREHFGKGLTGAGRQLVPVSLYAGCCNAQSLSLRVVDDGEEQGNWLPARQASCFVDHHLLEEGSARLRILPPLAAELADDEVSRSRDARSRLTGSYSR